MEIKDGYVIWNKGGDEKLSDYFKQSEFTCQCSYDDCKEQKISQELIRRLSGLREHIRCPIKITSGFRCIKHQKDLRESGVNTVVAQLSQHELGNAADIKCSSLPMDQFVTEIKTLFFSVGLATNFVHVDLRPLREDGSYRIWKY